MPSPARLLSALSAAFALFLSIAAPSARAAVTITASTTTTDSGYGLDGPAYAQNFDALPASGSFPWTNDGTLAGWYAADSTGTTPGAATTLTGSGNAGDLVVASVGASGQPERALAYHTRLAANPTHLGLAFLNQSGRTLTTFSLGYTAEQWRESTDGRTLSVSVQYRVGATAADLPSATGWTTLPGMEFSTLGGSATASATLTSGAVAVNVPDGGTLWLRWRFTNTATSGTSSHDILAIDQVVFSAAESSLDRIPTITDQPASLSANVGESVTFTATADGHPAPTYQWFRVNGPDDLSPVPGATTANLVFAPVTLDHAGTYLAVATNALGSATSDPATLAVTVPPPAPPTILTPPASRTATYGSSVTFSVTVSGTPPFTYRWQKGTSDLPGQTAPTLTLVNLSASQAGSYRVIVTNDHGFDTSAPAILTLSAALPPSTYDLAGFAHGTTGGGLLPETDADYRKIYTAADLRAALTAKTTRVIEIMNDLDLGWNELPASEQTGRFRENTTPLLHPVLLQTGVSLIDVQDFTGLTIFSRHGARIRHAELQIKRCANLIIRNLVFDELWEWDESSKGDYDRNDWDYITIDAASSLVWIDHCDFGKAYDGVVDVKSGSNRVTLSWCRFIEDSGAPGSWVRRQIDALEAAPSGKAMYSFLRDNGFSTDDIVAVARSQKKGHLVGANDLDADNADLSVTLHHNLYVGMQDRLPRLRGGNAHAYNLHVDNRNAHAASQLYAARVAAMSSTNAAKLSNGTYKFSVTQNGSISTEGGAVLLEKSYYEGVRYALRNNQTDPSNPVYTGKIRGEDVIFKFGATDFRGGSDTPGHPLGPTQAPVVPFAWNGFATLPYTYVTHDPAGLPAMLAVGAGAGRVDFTAAQWLATSYEDPPVSAFDSFVTAAGLDPLTDGAPEANPSGDGIPNLLKFALGGDPLLAQPDLLPAAVIDSAAAATPDFVFTYERALAAVAAGLVFTNELSPDLLVWNPIVHGEAGANITVTPLDAALEQVEVRLPAPVARAFLRLRVTAP